MKLWGGGFTKKTHELVDEYNASISFDIALATYDVQGSIAHVNMLAHCGILTEEESSVIKHGLRQILEKIKNKDISFSLEDEDIHMGIEKELHRLIGETAGKLHTGRSRNDQVALDTHLYLRAKVYDIVEYLRGFMSALLTLAEAHQQVLMPGYTHLQRAEPVRFSHHMLAYFFMFQRDFSRLVESFHRLNVSPLGAGALAGSGFAVDRWHVAKALHFEKIYENSLDAVSDRDFVIEFLSHASLIMMHLSRLSEEMILWCSQEFSFIQLDDAFSTGSSMMPQKKNPDIAELARGKTARVYGSLFTLLTLLKGLPLAYNKDMQEDKEALFDTVNTVLNTLKVYTPMLASMKVHEENMKQAAENDYSNATQLANYLVSLGIPFRKAHELTGMLVLEAIQQKKWLHTLPIETYQNVEPRITEDLYKQLTVEAVVESHRAEGGTSMSSLTLQLAQAKEILKIMDAWLDEKKIMKAQE